MKRLLAWITALAFVCSPQIAFSQILLPILTGGFNAGGGGGGGTPAFVAGVTCASAQNGCTTGSVNMTGANFIAIAVDGVAAVTVSDSSSNTYACLTGATDSTGGTTQICYKEGATVTSSMTFTVSCTSCYSGAAVMGFSNVLASASIDQQSALNGTIQYTSRQATSITPTASNYLVLAAWGWEQAVTTPGVDSGFTLQETQLTGAGTHLGFAYLIQNPAAAVAPTSTWATASYTGVVQASFKHN